jgi:hypothetical protein
LTAASLPKKGNAEGIGVEMGPFVAIVGALITIIMFLRTVGIDPQSAPQQAVQELRYVGMFIGMLMMGVGASAIYLAQISNKQLEAMLAEQRRTNELLAKAVDDAVPEAESAGEESAKKVRV